MYSNLSRRELIGSVAGTALLPALSSAAETSPSASDHVPKICLGIGRNLINDAGIRRVKQLGVDYVLMGGPRIPWREEQLRPMMETLKAGGLTLGNLMIAGFPKTIYGKPGRDEEIENVKQSIQAAGKVGLPVIEYNFYAHRAMEGYYSETGRAGAGNTAFDYDRMKNLPPLPDEGAHSLEEMWNNITLFFESRCSGCRKSGRPPGAASQRPAGAAEPGLRANYGDRGRMEASGGYCEEPFEWHYFRLRRHPRDGARSGGSLPLLFETGLH